MGTTRITASGSDQLSYCAASTRNTSTTASTKTQHGRVAGLELQQGQLGPLGLHGVRGSSCWADVLHQADGLAGADARRRRRR